jgi:hypothetical protein
VFSGKEIVGWKTKMKVFQQIDSSRPDFKKEVVASTPTEAAKKLATKGETHIVLYERVYSEFQPGSGKIHVFRGATRPLLSSEKNSYTEARGIQRKPVVSKLFQTNVSGLEEAREYLSQN